MQAACRHEWYAHQGLLQLLQDSAGMKAARGASRKQQVHWQVAPCMYAGSKFSGYLQMQLCIEGAQLALPWFPGSVYHRSLVWWLLRLQKQTVAVACGHLWIQWTNCKLSCSFEAGRTTTKDSMPAPFCACCASTAASLLLCVPATTCFGGKSLHLANQIRAAGCRLRAAPTSRLSPVTADICCWHRPHTACSVLFSLLCTISLLSCSVA
jgi:hypothetical protein